MAKLPISVLGCFLIFFIQLSNSLETTNGDKTNSNQEEISNDNRLQNYPNKSISFTIEYEDPKDVTNNNSQFNKTRKVRDIVSGPYSDWECSCESHVLNIDSSFINHAYVCMGQLRTGDSVYDSHFNSVKCKNHHEDNVGSFNTVSEFAIDKCLKQGYLKAHCSNDFKTKHRIHFDPYY